MLMRVGLLAALLLPSIALSACSSNADPLIQGGIASPALEARAFRITVATATKQPIHLSSAETAFEVAAYNDSAESYKRVTVRFDMNGLPVNGTLCETSTNGQCLEAPKPSIDIEIRAKATVYIAAFVSAAGSIPHGTISVQFVDGDKLLGSGKVTVTTKT